MSESSFKKILGYNQSAESTIEVLPGSPGCFICDNNDSNPRALKLMLLWDAKDEVVRIPICPDQTWCGYAGVVHGGLVSSVLDEAMAWVINKLTGEWAFTADYHIRYKQPVQPGKNYTVVASLTENKRRKITAEASLQDEDGVVYAQATGIFLAGKGPQPQS